MFKKISVNRKKQFNDQVKAYLDLVREAVHYFREGMDAYLEGDLERYEAIWERLSSIEKSADELLREINHHIYSYMLYPSMQKDISRLLNTLDDIVDTTKQVILQMSIEKPQIPGFLSQSFRDLTASATHSVDQVTAGTESFFRNTHLVEDHVNKVFFYEREADRIEKKIKATAHSDNRIDNLAHKQHLCHFAEKVALPSDKANRVAKELLIYTQNKDRFPDPYH